MSTQVQSPLLRFETALGTCGIRWSEAGISEVLMPRSRMPHGAQAVDLDLAPEPVREAVAQIVALLGGERRDLREIALDESDLDAFQRAVYAATREIGPGETATYGEIARAAGEPQAARDVGATLGRNPFPIVVPCHRVLAADGALTGFSAPGGIETKRRMLEIEGAPGFTQQALFA
ncbi:MAG TPA: methylated-DNA--[protein]-cysteine S-methyltransferase [Solirubrobacteraceae bacterium]|nr:methylated-DNA--[protein]-cysteine S-methyltransferase [Solirubrobacteraceae bacterium]